MVQLPLKTSHGIDFSSDKWLYVSCTNINSGQVRFSTEMGIAGRMCTPYGFPSWAFFGAPQLTTPGPAKVERAKSR